MEPKGHMGHEGSFDINEIVDGQKLRFASVVFLVITGLVLVSDGFDLAAVGVIAPALCKYWQIPTVQLVPALSASIVGMMMGGALLGALGDEFGRKRLIIVALALISTTTLAAMMARSASEFTALRFVTGLGLGGVVPNTVALIAELNPRRSRGRMLVAVATGVIVGTSLPGLAVAMLAPQSGWRPILLVGGMLPLAVAALAARVLPESVKYLVERGDREAEARSIARRMRPDLEITDDTRITVPRAAPDAGAAKLRRLFGGDFALVTPLLWITQVAIQMAGFFALTWLPTLLQAGGASAAQAGINTSLFAVGGFCSALVLLFIMDRFGVLPLIFTLLAGVPLVATMTLPGLPAIMHAVVIAGAGFCVQGAQLVLTVLLGIFYPTALRSSGTGATLSVGRLGS